MTDGINTPAPAAAEAAPVTTPVAPAPAVESVVAPAPTADPVVVAPEATVLGAEAPKAEPDKPVEAPQAAEGDKPAEAAKQEPQNVEGQSAEPAPPPVYESFTLPEGFQADDTRLKAFTDILGEFETSNKVDHAKMQEFGQKAVDMYTQEVQAAVNKLNEFYTKSWDDQKTKWKESFLADPEIGGNRFQTTVDAANNFIRTHGGTAEQQAEFRALMDTSGIGNHPAMIRILAKAGQAMSEGRPLAASTPAPQPKSRVETLYGRRK